MKYTQILSACQAVSLLAIRPNYIRCMDPEFLHSNGSHVGFTEVLF